MNKLTKITLGLCVVKVGIETTKYISGKWGNGKMKKNIENIEKAMADAVSGVGKEAVKQFGAADVEEVKQYGESGRQEQKDDRESEKQIIETIERLTKDNENGKNDKGIEFFENLLLEKQKAREERNKRKEKEETEKRKAREKARKREMYMNYGFGLGGIVFIGTALLAREVIKNSF